MHQKILRVCFEDVASSNKKGPGRFMINKLLGIHKIEKNPKLLNSVVTILNSVMTIPNSTMTNPNDISHQK